MTEYGITISSGSGGGGVENGGDGGEDLLLHHCQLYSFTVESLIMGTIILSGMITNTIANAVLWHESILTAPVFLLQAALVADTAVLWVLFISETVPSLAYVIPLLENCLTVCHYIDSITRPLAFLAQSCSILFTLWAVMNRYIVFCAPTLSENYSDFTCARKQAVASILLSLFFALPMTLDTALPVTSPDTAHTQLLIENRYYFGFYVNGVVFLLFLLIPLLIILYFSIRLGNVVQSAKHLRRLLEPGFKMENIDITQVMLAMGVTLIISYLPKIALVTTQLIDMRMLHLQCGELQYYLHGFTNLFISINSASKLWILCIFGRRFRASLRSQYGSEPDRVKCKNRATPIYKCGDVSEMTLMSNIECTTPLAEEIMIFNEEH